MPGATLLRCLRRQVGNARAVDFHDERLEVGKPGLREARAHDPARPEQRIGGVIVEHQVAQAVNDRPPFIDVDGLRNVGMGTDDRVGAGVDQAVGEGSLRLLGRRMDLAAPVQHWGSPGRRETRPAPP